MNKINAETRREEFFRLCNLCVFSRDYCVCVACMDIAKNQFPEKIKKTRDDFDDLREASLEILVKYGGECNHDEVLRIIRDDQAKKSIDLLSEVASIMSDFLKAAEKKGLAGEEMSRARELIGRVKRFLDEEIVSCRKSFGGFQETDFLKETRMLLSSHSLEKNK